MHKPGRALLFIALFASWLGACTLSSAAPTPVLPSPTSTVAPEASPSPTLTPFLPATRTPIPRPIPSPTMPPLPSATPTPAYAPRLVAYFYGHNPNNQAVDIPGGQLTDLIYAFIGISAEGTCTTLEPELDRAHFAALRGLKAQNPGLHTLFAIGGYGGSARFSDVAASAAARRRFAQSCIQLMHQEGFDGIDLDWEYPVSGGLAGNAHRPEDAQNLTALLAEFRSQLAELEPGAGQSYLLSLAVPAGPAELTHFDLAQIHSAVDWITIMAYDFYTGGSRTAHFNAPLFADPADPGDQRYNGDAAVRACLAQGVPSGKVVLGVPFYGRGWTGAGPAQHGLYQPVRGPYLDSALPAGTWEGGGEIEYRTLKKYYLGTWERFWQAAAQSPWLYNRERGVMVTYEDPQSLAVKADYARDNRLGGIAIWQISSDDSEHSLLQALAAHLR